MNLIWRRSTVVAFTGLALPGLVAALLRLHNQASDALGWAWLGFTLLLVSATLIGSGTRRFSRAMVGLLVGAALALSLWFGAGVLLGGLAGVGWLAVLITTCGDFFSREARRPDSLADFYAAAVKARRVRNNPEQQEIVERLDQLAQAFAQYESKRHLPWASLLSAPRGVYLHGPAGRGKSFLLDGMYDISTSAVKARFHFHELMSALNTRVNASPPVSFEQAVRSLAPRASLIVIDEVNVLDVASAILFSRLVRNWWQRGCTVCISSNQSPEQLFRGVSSSHSEVSALISSLQTHMQVMALEGSDDYRLQKLSADDLYQYPSDAGTAGRFLEIVELLAESPPSAEPVVVGERLVACRQQALGVAWFDFTELCGGPHSYEDYLALAARYPNLLVSDVPQIVQQDQARRFAWLVEIVYDAKKRLILAAHVPRNELFAGTLAGRKSSMEPGSAPQQELDIDYVKILSRLAEMQSSEYNYSLA
ncbi:MAG: cell division protein ZapE [bacterium]